MPSISTRQPHSCSSDTICDAMRRACASTSARTTTLRSSLTISGRRRNTRSKLEWPAPKSSSDTRQPSSRSSSMRRSKPASSGSVDSSTSITTCSGPQAVRGQRVGDLADARAGRRRERARMHVEEQPLVGVLAGVGGQVLQQRGAVQAHARVVAVDAGEQLHRRHRRAGGDATWRAAAPRGRRRGGASGCRSAGSARRGDSRA